MEFRQIVCWMSGKHFQVLVNTFVQYFVTKIKYRSVAFSLLLGIVNILRGGGGGGGE